VKNTEEDRLTAAEMEKKGRRMAEGSGEKNRRSLVRGGGKRRLKWEKDEMMAEE
jgi:hypothetical protein